MKKVRKILIIAIVALFGYGFIANLQHAISIRKTYEYSFDTSLEMSNIKSSVITLQNDIEQIKKIENSSLGTDVLDAYIQILENMNQNLSNYSFMNYSETIQLTQKDLYQMLYDYGKLNYTNFINVYKKLVENNPLLESGQQQLVQHIYTMLLLSNPIYESIIHNYTYTSLDIKEQSYTVSAILSLYYDKLVTIHEVSELILTTKIESGENYE